ncbi:LmeA family phospholipid-binding protein [Streptomyces broussonetiae]|uniref:LmeA family phospholipid-binding protein n=1 Tax=Streptomyces broussonetiae TaxID=2686304 RepID=UPI0035E27EE1
MKFLAIAVVVPAVLFTVADRVSLHYADKEAERLAKEKYPYGNTTDSHVDVSIEGFPFLTQVFSQDLGHVSLSAGQFTVDTTANAQGGYLHVKQFHLDLHDVKVTSLSARSAEANIATGTLTLSYDELSDVVTRLAGSGGPLRVSQPPGSADQAAKLRITGTVAGRPLDSTGTLLAQGTELGLTVPGAGQSAFTWRVPLPDGAGFTAARSTANVVEISMVGHQVTLGRSRFER